MAATKSNITKMQKLTIFLVAAVAVLESNVVAHEALRMIQEELSDVPSNTPIVMMVVSDAPSASPIDQLEPPGEKTGKEPGSEMMMGMTPKPKAVSKPSKGSATASPTIGIVLSDPVSDGANGMMGAEKGGKKAKVEKAGKEANGEKDDKEAKAENGGKEAKVEKGGKEAKGEKRGKQAKAVKGEKQAKAVKGGKEAKGEKGGKDAKGVKVAKEAKEAKAVKGGKEAKAAKGEKVKQSKSMEIEAKGMMMMAPKDDFRK